MFSFSFNSENLNCAYPVVKETLPKSSLGYNTNTKYPIFPPLMNDGRSLIASHQPEAIINKQLIDESGMTTNWHYRKFLTSNAREIMTVNFTEACNDCGYYKRMREPSIEQENARITTPHLYSSYVSSEPAFGVQNSDLKQLYLSREQLNSRKVSPVITQSELLSMNKR
jgi:hypothetical protein